MSKDLKVNCHKGLYANMGLFDLVDCDAEGPQIPADQMTRHHLLINLEYALRRYEEVVKAAWDDYNQQIQGKGFFERLRMNVKQPDSGWDGIRKARAFVAECWGMNLGFHEFREHIFLEKLPFFYGNYFKRYVLYFFLAQITGAPNSLQISGTFQVPTGTEDPREDRNAERLAEDLQLARKARPSVDEMEAASKAGNASAAASAAADASSSSASPPSTLRT